MNKLIKSNQVFIKKSGTACIISEYVFDKPALGIAQAVINGRYPIDSNKKALNTKCDLVYFVLSGNGIVHTKDQNFTIETNDALFLSKNNWYWVQGDNLKTLLISAPEWTVEQYKEVE
ncbi:MAG: hypothetical protein WC436_03745 [Candidatus Babeliales bacterium]